jgi:hypothetical protein
MPPSAKKRVKLESESGVLQEIDMNAVADVDGPGPSKRPRLDTRPFMNFST